MSFPFIDDNDNIDIAGKDIGSEEESILDKRLARDT